MRSRPASEWSSARLHEQCGQYSRKVAYLPALQGHHSREREVLSGLQAPSSIRSLQDAERAAELFAAPRRREGSPPGRRRALGVFRVGDDPKRSRRRDRPSDHRRGGALPRRVRARPLLIRVERTHADYLAGDLLAAVVAGSSPTWNTPKPPADGRSSLRQTARTRSVKDQTRCAGRLGRDDNAGSTRFCPRDVGPGYAQPGSAWPHHWRLPAITQSPPARRAAPRLCSLSPPMTVLIAPGSIVVRPGSPLNRPARPPRISGLPFDPPATA